MATPKKEEQTLLKTLAEGLIKGEEGLAETTTKGLISGDFNVELLSGESMLSFLVYDMDMASFKLVLNSKAHKGMNFNSDREKALQASLKEVKKSFPPLSNKLNCLRDFIDSSELLKNNVMRESLKTAVDTVSSKDKYSILSPIFAAIVASKITAKKEDIGKIVEAEKSLEHLVLGLLEMGKVKENLHTRQLRQEVSEIVKQMLPEADVDNFFHDLGVAVHMNDAQSSINFIHLGVDKNSPCKMMYISENGTPKVLFNYNETNPVDNTRFLTDETLQSLTSIKNDAQTKSNAAKIFGDDKSYLLTLIKLLQEEIRDKQEITDKTTGESNSALAELKDATKLFVALTLICDKLSEATGEEMDNNTLFAIANPLIDLVGAVAKESLKKQLVQEGLAVANQVLPEELRVFKTTGKTISFEDLKCNLKAPEEAIKTQLSKILAELALNKAQTGKSLALDDIKFDLNDAPEFKSSAKQGSERFQKDVKNYNSRLSTWAKNKAMEAVSNALVGKNNVASEEQNN